MLYNCYTNLIISIMHDRDFQLNKRHSSLNTITDFDWTQLIFSWNNVILNWFGLKSAPLICLMILTCKRRGRKIIESKQRLRLEVSLKSTKFFGFETESKQTFGLWRTCCSFDDCCWWANLSFRLVTLNIAHLLNFMMRLKLSKCR